MRPFRVTILLMLLGTMSFAPAQPAAYKNPLLRVDERVRDLLARMTLEEKFWRLFMIPGDLDNPANDYSKGIFGLQISNPSAERVNAIQRYFVEKTRLGIPIIPFDEAVTVGQPRRLFDFAGTAFSASADGQRFLAGVQGSEAPPTPPLIFVVNWRTLLSAGR
jgi:hypothetical protein